MYVYILDYNANSIDELYLNGELDNIEVEETLQDDYGYNLDEIHYMCSYTRLTINTVRYKTGK